MPPKRSREGSNAVFYEAMSRKELQSAAKRKGIHANLPSADLIIRLRNDDATLAAAARRDREQARENVCSICLAPNPSVSMLCCGIAVHVECMSRWMLGETGPNNTPRCTVCRAIVPRSDTEFPSPSEGPPDSLSREFVQITHSAFPQLFQQILTLIQGGTPPQPPPN